MSDNNNQAAQPDRGVPSARRPSAQVSAAAAAGRFDLGGRVVVITGASKGIGRELTILLAETGAVVVPTVRTDADAADLASEAKSRGLTVLPQRLDVRDVASVTEAVSGIIAAHRGIDVLVNNAGFGSARDVTEADWDEMMAVNLRGVFFMSQAVARAMVAAGRGGRIINISSQGGLLGLPDAAVYCQQEWRQHVDQDARARVGEAGDHGQRRRANISSTRRGRRRSWTSRPCGSPCWARSHSASLR